MKNSLASRVLAVAVAALSSGCSLVLQGGGLGLGAGSAASAQRAASYDGDECERVLYDLSKHDHNDYNHNERKFPQVDDPKPASQMLLVSCARRQKKGVADHTIKQFAKIKNLDVGKVYFDLDDRRLDTVTMAVNVIQIMDSDFDRHSHYTDKKWRGLAAFYGEIIDRKALASDVAKVGLPEEANKAFLALYDDAVTRSKGMGLEAGEQEIYVNIPAATYKARKAQFKEFAELYKKLDELTAAAKAARNDPSAGDGIVTKLSALRTEFLAKCGKPECRSQPLWAHATRELALSHVARKAAIDAMVESHMHAINGSYTAGFAQAMFAAQAVYVSDMAEAYKKYKKAKESGVDEATALSLAGGTRGFNFEYEDLIQPKMSLPNYAEALDEKRLRSSQREMDGTVASTQPSGGNTRLVFEKETRQVIVRSNCSETRHIMRIRIDGTFEFMVACESRRGTEVVEKPPVVVLEAEAKNIQRGDVVRFLAWGEEARILEVKRGDKVVQIRGDLVGGG